MLTTTGLRWNLSTCIPFEIKDNNADFPLLFVVPSANQTSGFDGLLSTSNHLVPDEDSVYIETSSPIWWVAELRQEGIECRTSGGPKNPETHV